ncbi:hypothetical protein [Salmonella phage vB_SenAc-pSK20]|uniref:Uncharacterized protein n=1 Tax=Salmonella phage vB_STmST313_KE27 TaxID=3161178 RepID=A0AAU8GHP9_9CAUD|nr:hypothetical protein BRM13313_00169 [Salmonella phage BRM 13313]URQ08792.1 hypothetical protein BRM13312_00166 [Salmonella phage BRM 13312]WRQ13332.1 hypothetical protein [Salmonella phage vB_SenAc-pSK20]
MSIVVGSKVKEIKWMGQFKRKAILTVKARLGDKILLTDGDQELWDSVGNVIEVLA